MTEVGKKARQCLMVVDDDSTVRLLLQSALQGDYDMCCIPNGPKAAGHIASSRPSLVILDIDVPGSAGYSLCAEVRRQAELSKVPVLFMTVCQTNPRFFADLMAKGNSYIKKPFELPALRRMIERSLTPPSF
jgi:DNA-binding response OmpR family regulator